MSTVAPRSSEQKSANELAVERTELAASRTLMGADRTLMAWVRTALSMISFGFTIFKLLQGLTDKGVTLPRPDSPRNAGLFLIGLGTLSIAMGSVEYLQTLRELRRHGPFRPWRSSFVIAQIVFLGGLLLFLSILARIL